MARPRDRSALGIISIALFLIISYLLFFPHPGPDLNQTHYRNLISTITLSFNIVIILSWISSGIFMGLIMFLLIFITALVGVLRSGSYVSAVFLWSFVPAALIGYSHWKKTRRFEDSTNLKLEKLEEDINVLSDTAGKNFAEIKYLEEKLQRYLVLKDVAESLTTTLVLEDIVKLIMEKASRTLKKFERILLFLVDAGKQELMLSASQGSHKVTAKKGDIFDHWVLKYGIPLIVEDTAKDFRFSTDGTEGSKTHFRSLIMTPLLSGNNVIGILRMDSDKEGTYTQDDLRLLDIIGSLGAVAIQNAFLYSWIRELAIKDSLTGLFVRRYFMKRFQDEINRAARNNTELSLVMLDIDRFKWYNDKYGHATGDLVIKHISEKINSLLRPGDLASRYGGEEIAVLLMGSDRKKAAKTAESIRKKIEGDPLVVRRERHSVTVSIGVSSYPQDSVKEEDMVKIADERLYKAKSAGRNRTCAE